MKRNRLPIAVSLLLLAAFALRTAGLVSVPPGLSGDEAINGSDVLNVLRWGDPPIFFTNNYGREAGFLYLMMGSIGLFGANTLAIRLPAILCGLMGVLFTFILAHRLWNLRVAVFSAALMSVSFWPVFVSRIGLRAVSMVPLEALALYAVWRALQTRRWCWWIVVGISLGLIPYTYIPGRIFPAVVVGWLLAMWLLTPHDRRPEPPPGLKAFVAVALAILVFAPFGWFMIQHPHQANQRVEELSWELDSLKAGDPRPLLRNSVEALKMFTVRGDQYWRYNVSNRPVFSSLIGFAFYAGVVIAVARIRRPGSQLLLIWTIVMLTPSMFTGGAPSFLRSTGAMTPIYIFPAVAFDVAGEWIYGLTKTLNLPLRRQQKVIRLAYGGLGALLILGTGITDGVAYFRTWPNTPRVREIYTAGLAQVGRALNKVAELSSQPEVLVGADFAVDYSRDMVRFQTRYDGPIRWFVGKNAMVLPNPAEPVTDAYIFIADSPVPDQIAAPVLARASQIYLAESSNGAYESAGYLLPAEARSTTTWHPRTSLVGRFEGAAELRGHTLPRELQRGESESLSLYWRVPETYVADRSAPLWIKLEVVDDAGNIWERQAALFPYPPWDWRPGDLLALHVPISAPVDLPPGEVYVDVTLERNQRALPFTGQAEAPSESARIGPVIIEGTPRTPVTNNHPQLGLKGEIALEQKLMVDLAVPGDSLHTTLYWHALTPPVADYAVRLEIHEGDCEGPVAHTTLLPLWPDRHPTTQWAPGEPVRSFHHPPVPRDLGPGHYGITLDLVPATAEMITGAERGEAVCTPLDIVGRIRQFAAPDLDVEIDQAFEDHIYLLGITAEPDLEAMRPGDSVELTLYWQAEGEPSRSYTAFVHLYDGQGNLVDQHDSIPCGTSCPTHSWIEGEILEDGHTLALPEDSSSGAYAIGIGMYDLTTLERLGAPGVLDDVVIIPGPVLP